MLPGAWMGPPPSKATADAQEPVTTQKRSALNTEYKLKFRPFSDYTYVDGHFTGARDATDGGGEAERCAAAATPPTPWYEEVVELRKKASSYKVRGWGKEMAQPHLAHLYDREEDPGQLAERKIISALYLETLKPGFVREERGRSPVTTGGASVRQQSHPPPSSRKSPGAAKMALRLHAAEGSKRPHSAQPSTDRHTGDVVDRAKGRSPATPRTPTSRTDAAAPTAAKPRKRPTERPPSVDKAARPPAAAARPSTATARPAAEKKVERPVRPPTEKTERTEKKAEKTPRPATAKSERPGRAVPAAAAPAGAADSTGGKGIRGGTPRSRSAHRLAAKAKSPTKAERPLSTAMTTSAPAAAASGEAVKPAAEEAKPTAEETKPTVEAKPSAEAKSTEEVKPAAETVKSDAESAKTDVTAAAAPAAPAPGVAEPEPVPAPTQEPTSSATDEPTTDRSTEEMVRSVTEPTRVKSPEGMAPIKSPEPVNWTVPLDTGKTFTVTQNVMGGHGSPMSSRADSLRSPTDDSTRSPLARGVTDVSHLRNGEPAPPSVESPLANDLPATNGRDTDVNHGLPAQDQMMGSFHADVAGFGAQGDVVKSLQDPMTASMTGDDLKRSLATEDPMTASMTADDLKRSLHDPMATSMTGGDLKRPLQDPMTASMTGDDLKRSLHDPMASSMTGDELQRSFHADEPAPDAAMTSSFHAPPPVPPPRPAATQRVLDDPLMASAAFSRPSEPPPSLPERPPASSLFSSGSAGPPRFSHELFGSAGRPTEQKPEAAEKPLYRVI